MPDARLVFVVHRHAPSAHGRLGEREPVEAPRLVDRRLDVVLGGVLRNVAAGDAAVAVAPEVVDGDVVDEFRFALDQDLAVGEVLLVDRQASSRIAAEVGEPDRVLAGSEPDRFLLEDEPDRVTRGLPSLQTVPIRIRMPGSMRKASRSLSVIVGIWR